MVSDSALPAMYGDELYKMMFALCLCIAAISLQLNLVV
jgi:hypothetical protein